MLVTGTNAIWAVSLAMMLYFIECLGRIYVEDGAYKERNAYNERK